MKKIISILLAIICLVTSVTFSVNAADMDIAYILSEIVSEEIGAETEPTESTEPTEPNEPVEESQYVAKLYVCSRISFLGHAWIYIDNLTDDVITVGCYPCPPEQGVSVGTECFSRADGPGIYYNTESYMINKKNQTGSKYMSMYITAEQLEKVNKKILETNEWMPFTNCCLFASKVWNSVSDRHVAYGVFPFITALSIDGEDEPLSMYYPDASNVYKQKGKKDKATLKVVSSGSLVRGVG